MRDGERSVLYIDGHCSFCVRTGRYLRALDVFRRIRVVSFRDDASFRRYGLELMDLDREVHLVIGQRVFRGFGALVEVAKRVPWLWLAVPLLFVMERVGVGPKLYRVVAASRVVSLDGRRCEASEACRA